MSVVYALRNVRLNVPAGSAKPGPALGQALGPLGLNMAEFCKQFNDRTKNYEKDVPIPVILTGKLSVTLIKIPLSLIVFVFSSLQSHVQS